MIIQSYTNSLYNSPDKFDRAIYNLYLVGVFLFTPWDLKHSIFVFNQILPNLKFYKTHHLFKILFWANSYHIIMIGIGDWKEFFIFRGTIII